MNNTQWGWYPQPQPAQPSHPAHKQTLALVLILVSVALLICMVVGALLLYSGSFSRLLLSIEPSCTVGFTGSAATLTIEGWSANSDCTDLVNNQASFLGPPAQQSGGVYLYTSTPTNPVVCEMDDQGRHLIVRDEGLLKLVGNALCQALEQQAAGASTAPSPVAQIQTCTLRVTYHDMTMTITGSNADQDCNVILAGDPNNFLGQIGINFYREGIYLDPNPPSLQVVCELDNQGRHIIIRDDGGQYYGTKYCQELGQ